MHFSPSVNDASGDPFFIQIWEDSMGVPGNLMYTTDDFNLPVFYYPEYNLGVNGYYEYELPMLVPVSDTFYIGWRQSSADRLNIGFDKNVNRKQDIFYNLGTGFQNTIFDGALMMRPVFTSAMDNVASIPVLENKYYRLKVYPNPANQFLTIDSYITGELQVTTSSNHDFGNINEFVRLDGLTIDPALTIPNDRSFGLTGISTA